MFSAFKVSQQKDQISHETTEKISCVNKVVNVTCTFTNRLNMTASANLSIWTIWGKLFFFIYLFVLNTNLIFFK